MSSDSYLCISHIYLYLQQSIALGWTAGQTHHESALWWPSTSRILSHALQFLPDNAHSIYLPLELQTSITVTEDLRPRDRKPEISVPHSRHTISMDSVIEASPGQLSGQL